MRKALIFGNGLGMALAPQHFNLAQVMHDVWNIAHFLTPEDKRLISLTLGHENAIPQNEDQLDILHQAVVACKTLNRILSPNLHWLTEQGQRFPVAVAKYMHMVSSRLHLTDADLPAPFLTALTNFIRQTNSHVATLNYDRLLYSSFIDCGILSGYDGNLVDGVTNRGFDPGNLERLWGRTFGYYLHLHGSPLFYTDTDGQIRKLQRHEISTFTANPSEHIVLTHVAHKRSVISASPILTAYWHYLHRALQEATQIVIVGYSGCDLHLNELIAMYGAYKPIRVIEWAANHNHPIRLSHWQATFKTMNVQLDLQANILNNYVW
ncbi:TPA: hypothetical protein ACUT5J_000192 [Pseudomonas aeruginosa]|uniref:hypothetical protein n=1 Tax=Pseudomonas TaxID=286 RepID=UPI0006840532|nr:MULTISPECIES: hypothetical protein [Pseudomonas]KPE46388.1 hypothetical protein AOA76_12820 [Pseudomonas aeruginosa]MDA3425130.1 hypothetical protein [Pseudomonas aeruginosa]MDN3871510.1 hypothetical protein [Pseudomonas aeruginosa]MEB3899945.1 hypothetical protein [Pseudomonas putida]MEB5298406.1 hypothetical protein [Pseudomonas aeruginosa]